MSSTKLYDAVVKTGSYTDREGKEKGRFENIGSVMENHDGGMFLILKRTFNPAGIANPDNRDSIIVSFFEPQERDSAPPARPAPQRQQPAPRQAAPAAGFDDVPMDDDIPF